MTPRLVASLTWPARPGQRLERAPMAVEAASPRWPWSARAEHDDSRLAGRRPWPGRRIAIDGHGSLTPVSPLAPHHRIDSHRRHDERETPFSKGSSAINKNYRHESIPLGVNHSILHLNAAIARRSRRHGRGRLPPVRWNCRSRVAGSRTAVRAGEVTRAQLIGAQVIGQPVIGPQITAPRCGAAPGPGGRERQGGRRSAHGHGGGSGNPEADREPRRQKCAAHHPQVLGVRDGTPKTAIKRADSLRLVTWHQSGYIKRLPEPARNTENSII